MKEAPIIVICPGGAYAWRSPREAEPVAAAFERMGLRAEILPYTVHEEAGQPPLDLVPVRQLSERVKALKEAHPKASVLVCGFSAGGHLAATLGVHWKTLGLARPDGLILCYPVISSDKRFINEDSFWNLTGDRNREFFSLEKHVSADVPPAFLWHTAADQSVPVENSLLFAAELSRAGVPFELHVYPFGEHGLSLATKEVEDPNKNRQSDAHVAGWIDECEAWIHAMAF